MYTKESGKSFAQYSYLIETATSIAMTTRLGDECAAGKDSRAWDPLFLDSFRHTHDVSTGISNRGKALLEIIHAIVSAHRAHGHLVERITSFQHPLLDAQMSVHVNQAGHESLASAVDDCHLLLGIGNVKIRPDLFNHVVANQEVRCRLWKRVRFAVKDSGILKKNDLGWGFLVGRAPFEREILRHDFYAESDALGSARKNDKRFVDHTPWSNVGAKDF